MFEIDLAQEALRFVPKAAVPPTINMRIAARNTSDDVLKTHLTCRR